MSPPPRRLTFAVSTTLLSASLSLGVAGCDEGTVNPGPEKVDDKTKAEGPEETVNVGPEEGGDKEPVHVNEGPEPTPELEEKVNPGPEPEKPPPDGPNVNTVAPQEPEPKRVNTRPDSK